MTNYVVKFSSTTLSKKVKKFMRGSQKVRFPILLPPNNFT